MNKKHKNQRKKHREHLIAKSKCQTYRGHFNLLGKRNFFFSIGAGSLLSVPILPLLQKCLDNLKDEIKKFNDSFTESQSWILIVVIVLGFSTLLIASIMPPEHLKNNSKKRYFLVSLCNYIAHIIILSIIFLTYIFNKYKVNTLLEISVVLETILLVNVFTRILNGIMSWLVIPANKKSRSVDVAKLTLLWTVLWSIIVAILKLK